MSGESEIKIVSMRRRKDEVHFRVMKIRWKNWVSVNDEDEKISLGFYEGEEKMSLFKRCT